MRPEARIEQNFIDQVPSGKYHQHGRNFKNQTWDDIINNDVTSLGRTLSRFTENVTEYMAITQITSALYSTGYPSWLLADMFYSIATVRDLADIKVDISTNTLTFYYFSGQVVWRKHLGVANDYERQNAILKVISTWKTHQRDGFEAMVEVNSVLKGNYDFRFAFIWREFPGRLMLFPMMSLGAGILFYEAGWRDLIWIFVTGVITGLLQWIGQSHEQYGLENDFFAGFASGFLMEVGQSSFGTSEICSKAIILSNLFWFLYGVMYMTGIYEILLGREKVGVVRTVAPTIHSGVLAVGVALGIYFGFWDSDREISTSVTEGCKGEPLHWGFKVLAFFLVTLSSMGQFRVKLLHMIPVAITQATAVGVNDVLVNTVEMEFLPSVFFSAIAVVAAAYIYLKVIRLISKLTPWLFPIDVGMLPYGARLRRPDMWAIVVMGLYILVPGSTALRAAFASILLSSNAYVFPSSSAGHLAR